ncbi:14824_t:CDS:2, partial [Cetraspora pellucida]
MSLRQCKYPEDNPFFLKQNNTTYTYTIISEGFYPPTSIVCCTSSHSHNGIQYKISDNYLVQTKWDRKKSHHIVECEIKYEMNKPVFRIKFEENVQTFVMESKESATDVANKYLQKKNPNMQAKLSGIHVFKLNAKDLEQEYIKKHHSHSFKPFNILSESMKKNILVHFQYKSVQSLKMQLQNSII